MNNFDAIRNFLNTKSKNISDTVSKTKKRPGIGWEIGAYAVRGLSVIVPAAVIMFLENSWIKSGIGLLATLMIIALVIIFKQPIKQATSYAPGVIPFTIFIVVAWFFSTTAYALYTIGISGLGGSIAAIPLHLKYISAQEEVKSPEQIELERITNAIENLK